MNMEPIEHLLQDPSVMELMINRYDEIWVERRGQLELADAKFQSEDHLQKFITELAAPFGHTPSASNPLIDLRMSDGSRVNIVMPPIALRGAAVTMRKIPSVQPTLDQLVEWGSATREMFDFLRACVHARLNILVAGGTGSGKTTILNRLIEFIPEDERIVTVEGATELMLRSKNTVRLESRPANSEGKGEITMRDLVINSMKMRPDRIILGEAQGSEFMHFLQALNTGFDGSLFSMHAASARDALNRLEVMALMAGLDVPILSIREQMASGIQVVVYQQRLNDGTRKIMLISEVTGLKANTIELEPIFEFRETGEQNGRVTGAFAATGYTPTFQKRLK